MRGFGNVYRRKGTRYYWIRYSVHGKPQYESSKSTKKSDAARLLKKRLEEAQWLAEAPKRMTMSDLLRECADDVELRGLRSVDVTKRACVVVGEHIGTFPIKDVTTATLKRLQKQLRDDGYAPATVNRLVTTVYGALKLAVTNGYIPSMPQSPGQLRAPKPRQGFLEQDDYLAIHAELPDWGRDVFEMFYRTGWRRNEVLWLTWGEVDLDEHVIRLDPDRDKNGETRTWPIKFFLDELMERRAKARVLGLSYVFHRDGNKIGITGWRNHFIKACKAAGRSALTHDCRRTAARALERAGVPRNVAMKLIGHKTEEMYKRYRIVNEEDLEDAVAKLDEYYQQQSQTVRKRVVDFEKMG